MVFEIQWTPELFRAVMTLVGALATFAWIQFLKSKGRVEQQKFIFVWSIVGGAVTQVFNTLVTLPSGAAVDFTSLLIGATMTLVTALSSGGTYDHVTSVVSTLRGTGDGNTD